MKNELNQYAWTATVGEKGQIVIPKQAREVFNIKPGDTLVLLADTAKGIAIMPSSLVSDMAARIFADKGGDGNE